MERQDGIRHRKCANFTKQRADKKLTGKTKWFKNKSNENTKTNKDKKNLKTFKTQKNNKINKNTKIKTKTKDTRREPSAIMFVPRTRGGELTRRLQEKEMEISKFSLQTVKIIERNGDKLEGVLVRKDPIGETRCGRDDCFLCNTQRKEKGVCKNANVVYSITCNTCREEGEESTYWGETARAPYWRGVEHMTAYNKRAAT